MSDLSKAWKNGKRGKYRRIDGGKIKFIRSEDGKIEKGTDKTHPKSSKFPVLKGCDCESLVKCGCRPKRRAALDQIIEMLKSLKSPGDTK